MRRIIDPDEINQTAVFTLDDGTTVDLADADRSILERIARQLYVFRSAYTHALANQDLAGRIVMGRENLEDHSPLHAALERLLADKERGHRKTIGDFDASQLVQDATWTSSSGVTRPLTDLTPTHRANLVKWFQRNSDALHERALEALTDGELRQVTAADPWVAGTPVYRRLAELVQSETEADRAMDHARQVVRALEFGRKGDWPDR